MTEYQASDGEGHSFDLLLQADSDTVLSLRASGVDAFAEQEILLPSGPLGGRMIFESVPR